MMRLLFAPESPRPWALMRMVLAAALLWDVGHRWPFAIELYSTGGFPFPAFPSTNWQPAALAPWPTLLLHSSLMALLGMLLLGWHARLSAFCCFLLLGFFALLDAAGTMTKYTAISLHLLLLMTFAQPGGAWSLDAWRRSRLGQAVPLASAWARWLVRLLVCSIYGGAAITKMRLPDFATGDLLEFSLLDDAYGGRWLGMWLAIHPRLLIIGSLLTIVFELSFPVLVWVPKLRRPMLLCAVLFHLGLAATMHLEIFSPVMFAALCAFLEEKDLQAFPSRCPQIKKTKPTGDRFPKPSWQHSAGFCMLTAAAVAGLMLYQYQTDAYGVFHPTKERSYRRIEAATAQEMIDAFEADPRDYVHRIELGSRLGYRHVYGETRTFRSGEVVYVMARILQPHPAWELEWQLVPPDSPEAAESFPQPFDASLSYASIGFSMKPGFPAGEYRIRLFVGRRFGEKELVAERPFLLVKDP